MLRMKKVKMLFFDTAPLQHHCFWVPVDDKTEPQDENDDRKAMLIREGLRTSDATQERILGSSSAGDLFKLGF